MSFSVHRPGRFGADGRFTVEQPQEEEPLYLSDVLDETGTDGPESGPVDVADPTSDADAQAAPEPVDEPQPEPRTRAARTRRPRRRMPLSRRLAILGGADGEVLDDVPVETSRFVQMFFVLVGTALVSAISMFFALITGVRVAVWIAVPLALVWALIIFNLDRFLTSTMRSTRNLWRLLGLAFPRVIMAALIGIVVAEPLVLQIFQNDIAREVTTVNVAQAQSDQEAVANGPEKQALDAAAERVTELENQAATGIVAGTSSTSAASAAAQANIDQLTEQLAAQQAVIDQARAVYQCELTGEGAGTVPGCTGVPGQGASLQAAQSQLTQAQATYDGIAAELSTATSGLAAANAEGTEAAAGAAERNKAQAQDQLPAARDQYDAALAAYNARAATVADTNAGAMGMLSQLGALARLSEREPALAWAHWLIAALFFMIELLPVLVKVLTSWGDPSLYEKADAMRRQVALDRVKARTWRERASIVTDEATA
ncbi:DUF4407 domain-containing protein [Microbacterium sp. GXF7504]